MTVIVCTLESDHGFGSASAPSHRVMVCAPRLHRLRVGRDTGRDELLGNGVVDRQLLRGRGRCGQPVRPAVADIADRDLYCPCRSRDHHRRSVGAGRGGRRIGARSCRGRSLGGIAKARQDR